MDEPIIEVVVKLIRVHETMGESTYRLAAHAAMLAIARAVLLDAQAAAEVETGNVIDLSRYSRAKRATKIFEDNSGETE